MPIDDIIENKIVLVVATDKVVYAQGRALRLREVRDDVLVNFFDGLRGVDRDVRDAL